MLHPQVVRPGREPLASFATAELPNAMTQTTERHEFQAEVKQLLDLMIHSLYSDRDIGSTDKHTSPSRAPCPI